MPRKDLAQALQKYKKNAQDREDDAKLKKLKQSMPLAERAKMERISRKRQEAGRRGGAKTSETYARRRAEKEFVATIPEIVDRILKGEMQIEDVGGEHIGIVLKALKREKARIAVMERQIQAALDRDKLPYAGRTVEVTEEDDLIAEEEERKRREEDDEE